MGVYEVRFLDSTYCGTQIASFRFSKPEGYSFEAGQHGVFTLDTAEGRQGKPFTHAQAPDDPYLEITTRLSGSAFKNALLALKAGDAVPLTGPRGRLVAPPDLERVAFLVGGVGITPARSILRDALHRSRSWVDAVLFFGNRDESCIPYREEFEAMRASGVCVVHVLEQAGPDWQGETGFVSAEIVARHADIADGRLVFVSGPPVMVDAMERVLDQLGVEPSVRMIERFAAPAGS